MSTLVDILTLEANPLLGGKRIKEAPSTAFYIPDFISPDQESVLLEDVDSVPKPKWEQLGARRLQNWGGILGPKGSLIPDDMAPWLESPLSLVRPLFPPTKSPNHVLVNEYTPGQGIMPHTDGPAFLPLISTLSLGSHALLDFYRPLEEESTASLGERWVGSLLLEPRSLVVLTGDLYSKYLHGINPIKETLVRWTRVSLTIRNVPKVAANSVARLLGRK